MDGWQTADERTVQKSVRGPIGASASVMKELLPSQFRVVSQSGKARRQQHRDGSVDCRADSAEAVGTTDSRDQVEEGSVGGGCTARSKVRSEGFVAV